LATGVRRHFRRFKRVIDEAEENDSEVVQETIEEQRAAEDRAGQLKNPTSLS